MQLLVVSLFMSTLYSANTGKNRDGSSGAMFLSDSPNAIPADAPPAARIMIVDDNKGTTNALSLLVRKAGFEPVGCFTGQEALDSLDGPASIPLAAVIDI